MFKFKKVLIAAIFTGIILAAAAFSIWWITTSFPTHVTKEETTYFTVVDYLGREVPIEEPPNRIVSMAPSVTEILFALGVGDKVVGVTEACNYPAEAQEIEKIREAFGDYNVEKIVELEPDLVVMDRYLDLGASPGSWLSKLEEVGLTVVVVYPKTLDDVFSYIEMIGQATMAQENATNLVSSLEQRVNAVKVKVENVSEDEKPRVFSSGWYDGVTDPWTAGYGTFADDVIRIAGGINVAGIKSGFFQMSLEALVWSDPEIIIVVEDYVWRTPTYDSLMHDDRLQDITAMKNGAIYEIDADLLSRAGPRLVEGLEETAKVLYPELFQ
jgi:iron complex transport system substrate-binding protein